LIGSPIFNRLILNSFPLPLLVVKSIDALCRLSAIARNPMKNWEVIADNLSKAGWSYGYVSAVDSNGRAIWIADAHRDDGKRFIVRADEKLTAILELESAIRTVSP